MRIVVSDSSCLIDLHKASLIGALLKLPYEILIPDTLFEEELLSFTDAQKRALVRSGLKVMELPGDGVLRAQEVARAFPAISIHDGFAFALAERNPGCILLTGDGRLRTLAIEHDIEVHGVLWVIDELHHRRIVSAKALHAALMRFSNDATVRLPSHELTAYIRRYGSLL